MLVPHTAVMGYLVLIVVLTLGVVVTVGYVRDKRHGHRRNRRDDDSGAAYPSHYSYPGGDTSHDSGSCDRGSSDNGSSDSGGSSNSDGGGGGSDGGGGGGGGD